MATLSRFSRPYTLAVQAGVGQGAWGLSKLESGLSKKGDYLNYHHLSPGGWGEKGREERLVAAEEAQLR